MQEQFIIYGAGDSGERLLKFLGKEKVYCFIDKTGETAESYMGCKLYPPSKLRELGQDYPVIIATLQRAVANSMAETLQLYDARKFLCYDEIMQMYKTPYDRKQRYWERWNREEKWVNTVLTNIREKYVFLSQLILSVGQACNLHCKNCGNMAPHAPHAMFRYSLAEIKKSLAQILDSIDYLFKIQIQGGEPFLYSHLNELLAWLGKQEKIGRIVVATNGTVVCGGGTLTLLKDNKVLVRISDYNLMPEKIDEMERLCNVNGIRHRRYKFAGKNGKWFDMGQLEMEREQNDEAVHDRFRMCLFQNCLHLERGTLMHCSRAAVASVVQGFSMQEGIDFIDVLDNNNLRNEISAYIRDADFMEACRYCNGCDYDKVVTAAEQ